MRDLNFYSYNFYKLVSKFYSKIYPWISITKPGIIFGNIITLIGGFFLAQNNFNNPNKLLLILLMLIIGTVLIIAASCVLNNYIDSDIDRLMERTKERILVKHVISDKSAIIYATVVGLLGFIILYIFTNKLTVFIALIGFLVYIFLYSLYFKRHEYYGKYGILIGSIAGAVPPVMGYCAVKNCFDIGAFLLFSILFTWQMPHFYAIALYRLADYKKANIPILPLRKTIFYTKINILIYIILFGVIILLPTLFNYTGLIYLIIASVLGAIWSILALLGLFIAESDTQKNNLWARKVFIFSIIIITILFLTMAIKK